MTWGAAAATAARARAAASAIPTFEVDLSSDIEAQPTEGMRRFMCGAVVGNEQKQEDPTTLELEERVAALTGKPAALFVPSGTMCNIIACHLHCRPGDQVLLHQLSHVVYGEFDGPAVHAGAGLRLLDGERGIFDVGAVEAALQGDFYGRRPRGRLLLVENTHNLCGGSVWPLDQVRSVCAAAHRAGLATHLDGARLLNAAVAADVPVDAYCEPFDSAWIDLAKGLGCPAGAVLVGSADFVERARHAKRLFGGGMHQTGMLAAAGLYALDHHVERLAEDHRHAALLATELSTVPGVTVDPGLVQTNIVHFDVAPRSGSAAGFVQRAAERGVRFVVVTGMTIRAVTHLDVRGEHIPKVVDAVSHALRAG